MTSASESELEKLIKRGKKQSTTELLAETFDFDPAIASSIESIDSPISMAARSASPNLSPSDREELLKLAHVLCRLPPATRLIKFREKLLATSASASSTEHELGYEKAITVRGLLKNLHHPLDIEKSLRDFGCDIRDVQLDDKWTDGVVLWRPDGQALIAANTRSLRTSRPWGRRAMLAHELFHLLFDSSSGQLFGESTSDWSPSPTERQANAFAAELLLPLAALPIPNPEWDWEHWDNQVVRLCKTFQTGRELTVRQLENRRRMPRQLVELLLDTPGPAEDRAPRPARA